MRKMKQKEIKWIVQGYLWAEPIVSQSPFSRKRLCPMESELCLVSPHFTPPIYYTFQHFLNFYPYTSIARRVVTRIDSRATIQGMFPATLLTGCVTLNNSLSLSISVFSFIKNFLPHGAGTSIQYLEKNLGHRKSYVSAGSKEWHY